MHKDLVLDDVIVWILTESHQRYFTRFFIGNIAYVSKYTITAPRSDLSNPEERWLPYHFRHKFRHGHIQYALANAETIADYKAMSMNVMQAYMEIADEFYSNLNDGEIQNRISGLKKKDPPTETNELELFRQFLTWKKRLCSN